MKFSYINLHYDRHGYADHRGDGDSWHDLCAEHNDAHIAASLSYNPDYDRCNDADRNLSKLRRQIENRLRKDRHFLYRVAVLYDNL